jgi:hypothetical protein
MSLGVKGLQIFKLEIQKSALASLGYTIAAAINVNPR